MDSLYLLIPVALVFVAVAAKLLLWAIDNGQYDDLDKEGWRILADEESAPGHANRPEHRGDDQGDGRTDEGCAGSDRP